MNGQPKNNQQLLGSTSLLVFGALLMCGALLSNSGWETLLLTNTSRSLGWGATLFRVLLAMHGITLLLAGWWWRKQPATDAAQPKTSTPTTSRTAWLILAGLCVLDLG